MDQIRRGTSLRRARSTSDRSSPHFKHWEITKYGAELFFFKFFRFFSCGCVCLKKAAAAQSGIYQVPLEPPITHPSHLHLITFPAHLP
jgi:hypothetical protein